MKPDVECTSARLVLYTDDSLLALGASTLLSSLPQFRVLTAEPALSSLVPHSALSGNTAVVSPASNGRGTATMVTSVATYGVAYYIVDSTSVLVLETDGARVSTGAFGRQF